MGAPVPGFSSGRTFTPRTIIKSTVGLKLNPNIVVLDADKAYDGSNTGYPLELREGYLLGKITATGLYRGCTRTRVNGAHTSVNAITVDNAAALVVGDSCTCGAVTGRTITAINYSTNVVTLSGAALSPADNAVFFAEDGSKTLVGVLDEYVKLTDNDGVARDMQAGRVIIAGLLDRSMILGDIASVIGDDSTNELLKTIQFSDNY